MKTYLWIVVLALTLPWHAWAGCRNARGHIVVEITNEGPTPGSTCQSEVGVCTKGRITGSGFLNGRTHYTAHVLAGAADDPYGVTYRSYRGTMVLTNARGTLTVNDLGIWDVPTGLISSQNTQLEGTGRYRGARGTFFTFGQFEQFQEDNAVGFASDISGQLCVDGRNARELDSDR